MRNIIFVLFLITFISCHTNQGVRKYGGIKYQESTQNIGISIAERINLSLVLEEISG